MASRNEAAFVVEVIDRFFRLRECDDDTFARGRRCAYASMGRCTAPCEQGADAKSYHGEVTRVRDFLNGADDSVCERIEAEMMDASAALDFEKAATYRDWLQVLRRMLEKRQGVAARVLNHNAVIVHRPSAGEPVRLLAVSRGRHAETLHVVAPLSGTDRTNIQTMLRRCFIDAPTEQESYREKEVDEIYLLTHWLYVHRKEVSQVRWEEHSDVIEMTHRVVEAIGEGEESLRASPPIAAPTVPGRHPRVSRIPHISHSDEVAISPSPSPL